MRENFVHSLTEYIDRHRGKIALTAATAILAMFLSATMCIQSVLFVSAANRDASNKIMTLATAQGVSSDENSDSVLKLSSIGFDELDLDTVDMTEENELFASVLDTISDFLKCSKGEGGAVESGSANVIEEIKAEPESVSEAETVPVTEFAGYTFAELGISQMSTIDVPDSVRFTADGVPVNYSYALSGKTSAYSSGYITSTGTGVYPGIVAVNPNIIPYGTRLWIVGYDGTVYGYAVAADTGGFIYFSDPPLADLYMYSESQCEWWGIRGATIYVLD